MKKLSRMLALLVGLALISGGSIGITTTAHADEANALPTIEVEDGEGQTVATLATLDISSDKPGHAVISFSLENRGERALTKVEFTLLCVDCEGNVISNKPTTCREFFLEDPVQAGETRLFGVDRWFKGAENTVTVAIDTGLAADERDIAPWTEPKPNNLFLDFCNDPGLTSLFDNLENNPPIQMEHHVDEALDETVTDPAEILAVIEGLRNMRVGDQSDLIVTDSGISYLFTMADGAQWGVFFEAPGLLSWHGKNYVIENS